MKRQGAINVKTKTEDCDGAPDNGRFYLAAAGFVIVTMLFVAAIMPYLFRYDFAKAGQFGDMFGAANALFYGFAFLMFIVTVSLQRNELVLQRNELKQTRLEFEKQSAAFEKQNEVLEQQRFEGTFFQLLRLHSQIVDSLDAKGSSGNVGFFAARLSDFMNQYLLGRGAQHALNAYEEFHRNNLEHLGHYFRTLYHIVRMIDDSDLSDIKKQTYMNLLRAIISKSELVFLCLNCTTTYGRKKFKPLVEKYSLLENCEWTHDYADQFRTQYNPSAFGEGGGF